MIPSVYKRLLSIRATRQPLLGVVIARLPVAAMSLAVILMVREETGSFAVAGAVQACLAGALAISFPVQGRIIDRFGQSGDLLAAAALNPLALTTLVFAADAGASTVALCAIGVLAGATTPAISSSMRTLWASIVADPRTRQSAFALDAVLLEVSFIVGPLGVAALVALGSPSAAVLANAGISSLGTLIFALSRASRSWRGHGGAPVRSPLRSVGILILALTELATGIGLGAMEIGTTAFATAEGSPGLAGALIAVQGAASMAGGLWYGSRVHRRSLAERYPRLCLLIAVGFAPLLVADSFAVALPLFALSGFAFAPAGAVLFALIDELAPRGTNTEASTWMQTAIVGGIAAGNAVGGVAVAGGHPHRGFAIAVAAMALGWLVASLGGPALRRAVQPAPA